MPETTEAPQVSLESVSMMLMALHTENDQLRDDIDFATNLLGIVLAVVVVLYAIELWKAD